MNCNASFFTPVTDMCVPMKTKSFSETCGAPAFFAVKMEVLAPAVLHPAAIACAACSCTFFSLRTIKTAGFLSICFFKFISNFVFVDIIL